MNRALLHAWPAIMLAACTALPPAPADKPPPAPPHAAPPPAPPQPAPAPAAPAPAPGPAKTTPPKVDVEEAAPVRRPDARIRFVAGSERIDESSTQALAAIAQRWSRDKSLWVLLRAQSDPGGSREYAQARALQDSHEVEMRLVQLGVPERRIRALSHSRRSTESTQRQVDVFLERFRPE